jgi:hypothetical protein
MARVFASASSQYLEVDSTPVTGTPITFACCIKPGSATANDVVFWIGDKDAGNEAWMLLTEGGNAGPPADPIRLFVRTASGGANARTTTGYTVGKWHHICAVMTSPGSRAVYIDGGSKGTDTVSKTPAGVDRVSLGRQGDSSPGNYFEGSMTYAAIWNAALTDAEVASLPFVEPPFIRPESLVFYDDMVGDADNDIVGGLHLTPFNGPTVDSDGPGIISQSSPRLFTGSRAVADLGPNF